MRENLRIRSNRLRFLVYKRDNSTLVPLLRSNNCAWVLNRFYESSTELRKYTLQEMLALFWREAH